MIYNSYLAKNHSTNHAGPVMFENITKSFEDKYYTVGVFLDLSKAFDTNDYTGQHTFLCQESFNNFSVF